MKVDEITSKLSDPAEREEATAIRTTRAALTDHALQVSDGLNGYCAKRCTSSATTTASIASVRAALPTLP